MDHLHSIKVAPEDAKFVVWGYSLVELNLILSLTADGSIGAGGSKNNVITVDQTPIIQ